MDNKLLIESLLIAKDNFDYDGEYEKAEQVEAYIHTIEKEGK